MAVGVVLGATNTGAGKSSITIGMLAAFASTGLKVQGFKAGPDYLDPTYHRIAAGGSSYNLDELLTSIDLVRNLYAEKAGKADVSIVEGVMGLFDGRDETFSGSTYKLAGILKLPVLLIVDAEKIGTTIAPVLYGYLNFRPDLEMIGVVLNKVAGPMHEAMLAAALRPLGVKIYGVIYKGELPDLTSRHLGLIPATEERDIRKKVLSLKAIVMKKVDLAGLYKDLHRFQQKPENSPPVSYPVEQKGINLGYALDAAFNFYYNEGIEYLRDCGINLVPVSPLKDRELPDVDGLYLGGGYPELFAEELAQNRSFILSLKRRVAEGLPVYGECGGFIYLSEGVEREGVFFQLAGILPGRMQLTSKLQGLGYYTGSPQGGFFSRAGISQVFGHKFHYTACCFSAEKPAYLLQKKQNAPKFPDGIIHANVFASFLHLNFFGQAHLVQAWIQELTCNSRA